MATLLTVAAAAPLLLIGLTAFCHRTNRRAGAAIFGATAVHQLVLVTFPLLHSLVTGFYLDNRVGVSSSDLVRVYVGEALFVYVFCAAAVVTIQLNRPARARLRTHSDRLLIAGLCVGAAWLYIPPLFGPHYTVDDVWHHAELVRYDGWSQACVDWLITFIRWPGLAAAALVAADRRRDKRLRAVSCACLASVVLTGLANGYRGGIIWVVGFMMIAAYIKSARRPLGIALAIVIVTAPLFSWMKTDMVFIHLFAPDGVTRLQLLPHVWYRAVAGLKGTAEDVGSSLVESSAERAEGPRNSVGLYKLYDDRRGAGAKPIIGALWMPIPRLLWPEKPVGGSIDATNEGAAIYQVQRLKPHTSPMEMGPILASAHAYWEGGWLWLCIAAAITGILWGGAAKWASKSERDIDVVLVMSLLAALPIDGLVSALNPLYTFVLVGWKTVVPMTALIVITTWSERLILSAHRAHPAASIRMGRRAILQPPAKRSQ